MAEPRRPEHADNEKPITGTEFLVRRHLERYAYPANGNAHNPTPEYRWFLILDGKVVDTDAKRRNLVAAAREPNAAQTYRDGSLQP